MAALLKALQERPSLQVDVPMTYSAELDGPCSDGTGRQEAQHACGRRPQLPGQAARPNMLPRCCRTRRSASNCLPASIRLDGGKEAGLPAQAAAYEALKKRADARAARCRQRGDGNGASRQGTRARNRARRARQNARAVNPGGVAGQRRRRGDACLPDYGRSETPNATARQSPGGAQPEIGRRGARHGHLLGLAASIPPQCSCCPPRSSRRLSADAALDTRRKCSRSRYFRRPQRPAVGDPGSKPRPGRRGLRHRMRATPEAHTDIPRLRAGGVGAQFWSVYAPAEAPGSFARPSSSRSTSRAASSRSTPTLSAGALTAADVRAAKARAASAPCSGAEGGHAIENSLGALRAYYDLGARYMTLTHNVTLDWADAGARLGQARRADDLRRGSRARDEPARHARRPVARLAGHDERRARRHRGAGDLLALGGARDLCDHPRNVPDSILRGCRRTAAW